MTGAERIWGLEKEVGLCMEGQIKTSQARTIYAIQSLLKQSIILIVLKFPCIHILVGGKMSSTDAVTEKTHLAN